jgi:hypothetical protein
MTCIVGLVAGGRVVLGADSAGVGGLDLRTRAEAKVFRRGPYLVGYTTSFRMGQLLKYTLKYRCHQEWDLITPQPTPKDDLRHMATEFVDNVRECLKAGGFAEKTNEAEKGGHFLVGYRGRLYEIESDYQVATFHDAYAAVGCGADFALGALEVLDGIPGGSAECDALEALKVAEKFSAGVRGPFTILASDS